MSVKSGQSYLDTIKQKIRAQDLPGAEKDLHYLIVNRDFDKLWGAGTLPVMWGFIAHIRLTKAIPTAIVDLANGEIQINPQFLLDKIDSLEDLLFVILHERDHRILRRLFRINWHKLYKMLDYKKEWIDKIRNVVEDVWINASVRCEMGINANLPENCYCWTKADADSPGKRGFDNPKGSGFDPEIHKIGEPKSEDYALLTCLSQFCDPGIQSEHGSLYFEAKTLQRRHNIRPIGTRYHNDYGRSGMPSFPQWFDIFCDWFQIHKSDLAMPSPDCQGDPDCPVHGQESGDSDSSEQESDSDGEGEGGKGDQGGHC